MFFFFIRIGSQRFNEFVFMYIYKYIKTEEYKLNFLKSTMSNFNDN